MGDYKYRSGRTSGFSYENRNDYSKRKAAVYQENKNDDDLIIENNTVYEIDRECYEKMKNRKKR